VNRLTGVPGGADARQALLRALLRWKRADLTRSRVGLQPRSAGHGALTQDDVAELTGFSVRLYNQLENGKLRNPPPEFLDAVADGLRFSPDERRTLWLLAAGVVPTNATYATGPDVGLTRLANALYPNPAYVTDAAWNVQAANRAVAEWFVDFAQLPVNDRNIAKWIFCYPHSQHIFVNHEQDFATVFIARLRAVMSRFPEDRRLAALIEEMRQRSPLAERLWRDDSAVYIDPPTETRIFRRPGHTDPNQPDDALHHVPIDMVIMAPLHPDDERRVVAFLLPDNEPHRPAIRSTDACAVCARTQARTI
jgi:transcriptional regulator with XRE-family HTH domain